jgi:lysophospholipase L1-like esterase
MRKSIRILAPIFLLAISVPPGAIGGDRTDGRTGLAGIPLFDRTGGFIVISQDERGGLNLGPASSRGVSSAGAPSARPSAPLGIAAKTAPSGDIGAVWARNDGPAFEIIYGRIRDGALVESRVVLVSAEPLFSPDIDFDGASHPWLAWVRGDGASQKIAVEDLDRGRSWVMNGVGQGSALTPKVLARDSGKAWVIWTGRDSGHDRIFASALSHEVWSAPRPIHPDSGYPHMSPSAVLDGEGCPWIAWSAYDGNDYEIFSSRWAGGSWTAEERITDNADADMNPAIAVVPSAGPVVVWSKTSPGGHAVVAALRSDSGWSGEAMIGGFQNEPVRSLGIAVSDSRLGIAWTSGTGIKSRVAGIDEIVTGAGAGQAAPGGAAATPPFDPFRDENQYIAFGDSITFAENHGYEPSLESRLVAKFGAARIWNEGLGGETTADGLVRIVQAIADHAARYLLLMEGTNDVVFLDVSMEAAAFDLEEMARRGLRAGMLPLIATIIPRKDSFWLTPPFQSRIIELNGRIRKLASTLGIPLVDQYETFLSYPEANGGWESLILDDGVHPNAKGFLVMSESWYGGIVRLPFPPVNIRATRATDKILFYRRTGDILLWRNSSKLDPALIVAYRVYRKDPADAAFPAECLAVVPFQRAAIEFHFCDFSIETKKAYQYVITALRADGVEGPCSDIARDDIY